MKSFFFCFVVIKCENVNFKYSEWARVNVKCFKSANASNQSYDQNDWPTHDGTVTAFDGTVFRLIKF